VRDHRTEFRVATMCRVLGIHRSGFYAWMRTPISRRSVENERLLEQIRHFWNESDGVYGSPRIFIDLREAGESCGENRVARLMRENGITAIAKRRERGSSYVKPEQVSSNILDREFDQDELDTAWATDITYIRTWEGWLYLAIVMDLASRRVIGWSMQRTMHRDLVIQALLSALWRRRPERQVIIHSDQGSQYASDDWIRFCQAHNLVRSMSRRGNAYDNAAVESFFASLKKERVRRRTYQTVAEARADVFDYIEVFYNRKRRHEHLGGMSPVEFERKKLVA
jgi:putative transposase